MNATTQVANNQLPGTPVGRRFAQTALARTVAAAEVGGAA